MSPGRRSPSWPNTHTGVPATFSRRTSEAFDETPEIFVDRQDSNPNCVVSHTTNRHHDPTELQSAAARDP